MSEAVYFRGQDRAHYDYLEPRDVARFKRLDAQDAAMAIAPRPDARVLREEGEEVLVRGEGRGGGALVHRSVNMCVHTNNSVTVFGVPLGSDVYISLVLSSICDRIAGTSQKLCSSLGQPQLHRCGRLFGF